MKNNDLSVLYSRVGLGLIFLYGIGASIFFSYFAQLHVTLPKLPFPIFIGEILLLICLMLLAAVRPVFSRRIALLLGLYFGWVLIRALHNYISDGPLTCRNAALFYYPAFAIFGYVFYTKAKIPQQVFKILTFGAAAVLFFKLMIVWYWWTYMTMVVIVLLKTRSIRWRWIGAAFLTLVILLGREYLYKGPRAHFVSIFFACLFIFIYFGAILFKRRHFMALTVALSLFVCFIIGFMVFANPNDILSVTSFKDLMETYRNYDNDYQAKKDHYNARQIPVQLYNPKQLSIVVSNPLPQREPLKLDVINPNASAPQQEFPVTNELKNTDSIKTSLVQKVESAQTSQESQNWFFDIFRYKFPTNSVIKNVLSVRIRNGRSFDVNEGNMVFRLFVWRDMARELIEKNAWWGFSFGHPQRSHSLEVLGWAESEWGRDGWITPHNSYLHIIYRAGILGMMFIGVLLWLFWGMVADFFACRSVEGGMLLSVLIYWFVLSNFFVILEFPYNAIVIWPLFGITMAYRDKLKAQQSKG